MNIIKKFEFTSVSRALLIIIIAYLLFGFCSVLSASLFTHSYDLAWYVLLMADDLEGIYPWDQGQS